MSYGLETSQRVFGLQGYTTYEFNPSYENAKGGRNSVFIGYSNLESFLIHWPIRK